MDSICKVLENTRSGMDFYLLLGDFLDEFYRTEQKNREQMIISPPCGNALRTKQEYLSALPAPADQES